MSLTKVSTSMIGGSVNSSSDLSNWIASGELYCGISESITLSSNVTIPYTRTVTFLPGGLIIVPTGITLTINAQIVAGDQQIFQCTGTGTVVATNNQNGTGYYPIQTPVVKAIWFGVIPDAQFPTNTVPNPSFTGNIALGATPSGNGLNCCIANGCCILSIFVRKRWSIFIRYNYTYFAITCWSNLCAR